MVVAVLSAAALAWTVWQRTSLSHSSSPIPHSRPNVLLITIDTLRADRVTPSLTPNILRLAARGTSYSNVRATAPLTLPSHVSIMTGLTPPEHGVRENGVRFDRKSRTLARAFKDAGYRTAGFVGAYVLNRRFGIDEGFETYDDAVRRDAARAERLEAERPAADVIDAAIKWLPSAASPFFMWVHLYDPHAPYEPPPAFIQKDRAPYDGEVAYADAQVGRLLEEIQRRGLSGSTVIALAGDHGESLGEHGENTHGILAYEATLHVPMVVTAPVGGKPAVDGTAVSLASLGRVLLRSASLPVDGFGEAAHVYAESVYPRRAGWHALTVIADEQWKLILSSERELYDIRQDPGEATNVAAAHPTVVAAMGSSAMKLQVPTREPAAVAPEAAERLRALGYVSGSSTPIADDPKAINPARVISAWTEFERALGELRSGRARTALPILSGLVSGHPNAPVFQTTYAAALKEAGRAREAVAVYRAAAATWPDAALFHDLAAAAREAGDQAEALRAEQAALALDGDSAMALNGMGLLQVDAGRPREAVAAFERATRADPTNVSYWTNLGNALRAAGDDRGAETAYRKALEIDGAFADALNGLGTLMVQSGRAADAIPLFQRALARDPDLHEARLNLGIAYQQSGQLQQAAETYREVLTKTPPRFARERAAAGELLKTLR